MGYTATYQQEEPSRARLESEKGLLLLEFGADWCPICQALQPALEQILADHPDLRHLKVEDGKGKPLGRSFAVKLWPNLVLLRDGQVVEQLVRPSPEEVRAALQAL